MDLLFIAALWGGIITLAFIPMLCIMDVKTRQIPDKIILLYAGVTAPALILLYSNGLTAYYFATSIVLAIVWLGLRYLKVWGGADTKFLMVYSFVVPMNPINLYQTNFQVSSLVWIGAAMFISSILYYRNRNDVPMLIPISIGIIAAMISGAII